MDMENTTRIVLAWQLYEQGLTQERIAQQVRRHRETVGLWFKGIKAQGLEAFLTSYQQAKKVPRCTRQVDAPGRGARWRL
jgi:transposase